MRRVLVVGISGSGKTTFARRLSERRGLPFHEMDELALGPGWSTPPDLEATVDRITREDSWVFDSYGYTQVRDVLWARADTIVWLDFARRTTWPRMLRRSLARTLRREVVFNGNRETVRMWFTPDHPVWHAWRDHGSRRAYLDARRQEPRHGHLDVVRLATPTAADAWLAGLPIAPPG